MILSLGACRLYDAPTRSCNVCCGRHGEIGIVGTSGAVTRRAFVLRDGWATPADVSGGFGVDLVFAVPAYEAAAIA